MIGKRITAHILKKVIIFFPSMILLGGITLLIFPSYFIFGNDQGSGWLIFWLLKYMICLPTVFLDLISRPLEFLQVIEIILLCKNKKLDDIPKENLNGAFYGRMCNIDRQKTAKL